MIVCSVKVCVKFVSDMFYMLGQILHEKVHDVVVERLRKAYAQLRIGDPLDGEGLWQFKTQRTC